jgi:hypothetical protein
MLDATPGREVFPGGAQGSPPTSDALVSHGHLSGASPPGSLDA